MAQCGAKTRAGTPCKNRAMPNGRCLRHGGKSTGPPEGNKNAATHGLYSSALLEGEAELYDQITLGTVDEELKMARIQLRRALNAQAQFERQREQGEKEAGLEYESIETEGKLKRGEDGRTTLVPERAKTIRRKRDFQLEINRFTRTVADLEVKRMAILGGTDSDNPHEQAQAIRRAMNEIEDSIGRSDD